LFLNPKQLSKRRTLIVFDMQRRVVSMHCHILNLENMMTDVADLLMNLRRPRLLIRAARHGIADYRRERDLRRMIGMQGTTEAEKALPRLFIVEQQLEDTRKRGDVSYSLGHHIEVLIAIMAEARLLPGRVEV
jgi:hypothetical protein